MIKLGGLIDLKPLQEEKAFTATSKETGNVSVFKTKAARDAAIKAGSHEKRKTDKDTAVDVPGKDDKPKVNIFNKDKKEPKSSTPKLDKDGDGGMSSDTTYAVEDYLNKELGLDGSADLNSGGAIEYMVGDSRNAIIIGDDEIDGKPFSVSLSNIDTGESNDTYKSFDSQEDAMAYAKELGQKLKGGKDAGTQKSLFPDIMPDKKPTDDSDKIKDPKGMSKVVPKEIGTDVDKMEDWLYDKGGFIDDRQSFRISDENENELSNLYYKYSDAVESGDKKEIERTKKDYFEFIYANLEKNQNKPKGPETKDYWNSDNKPAPKVGKFNAKPNKDAVRGLDLLSTTSIGGTPKLTPEDMGDKEYERNMLRMLFNSLEDANFHTHNRFIFADLEGKPEKRNTPDYSNAPDDFSAEKEAEFDKWSEENTIFTKDFSSQFNRENERDDVLRRSAIDISKNSEWGGNEILAAYLQKLRKDGKDDLAARIQKSFEDAEKSMNEGRLTLGKLLPEPIINEGTRSQVGIIDRSGKIASAYVHYDGYPSNMKKGLKKHMKNEKDVLDLIKRGGASGIYATDDINFYDKKQAPMKGNSKDIEKYIKSADMRGGAEYVYLYNMKDKKWYFADTYEDKDLKKLF